MDDTLYLERDYIRSGFLHVGALVEKRFGNNRFSESAWELFLEGRRRTIFDHTLRRIGLPSPPALIEELVDSYRNHVPSISLAQDAQQCLDGLHSRYRLALITDGPLASQVNKARALQLDRWIELQILTDKWGVEFRKPHPRGFLAVQEQIGAGPSECMYVADNPMKDFTAPAMLGWMTVRVRREGGLHSQTISHTCKPNHELNNLSSLAHIVNGIRVSV